jgi:hypothetical protein
MSSELRSKELIARLDKKFENWRKELLSLYQEGASDCEVMVMLQLSPGAWEHLMKNTLDSDFNELVTLGRIFAKSWWESTGRKNLMTKGFNTALWTIQMKNRFGWSEKSEQSMTNIDLSNLNDEDLTRQIKDLQARYEQGRGKTV